MAFPPASSTIAPSGGRSILSRTLSGVKPTLVASHGRVAPIPCSEGSYRPSPNPGAPGSLAVSASGKAGGSTDARGVLRQVVGQFGEYLPCHGSNYHAIDGLQKAQDEDKTGSKATLTSIKDPEKLDVFLARGCGAL